jgi:hypothetical protein
MLMIIKTAKQKTPDPFPGYGKRPERFFIPLPKGLGKASWCGKRQISYTLTKK